MYSFSSVFTTVLHLLLLLVTPLLYPIKHLITTTLHRSCIYTLNTLQPLAFTNPRFFPLFPVLVVFRPVCAGLSSIPLSLPWGWLYDGPLWWWHSPLRQIPPRPRQVRGPAEHVYRWAQSAQSRWLCGGHSDSWWPRKPGGWSWRGALSPGPTLLHADPQQISAAKLDNTPTEPSVTPAVSHHNPLSWELTAAAPWHWLCWRLAVCLSLHVIFH